MDENNIISDETLDQVTGGAAVEPPKSVDEKVPAAANKDRKPQISAARRPRSS